jgi:hypothetical protein
MYAYWGRSPGECAEQHFDPVPQGGTGWHVMHMADHYTLRLAPGTKQRLTDRAYRVHLPERTLA